MRKSVKGFGGHVTRPLLGLAVVLVLANAAMAADKYAVDVSHTNVGFTVKHLMITKVHGKFDDFSGAIMFDEKDLTRSSATGTIKVASIDTSDAKRDAHLKSADFFAADQYPEITFRTTRVS